MASIRITLNKEVFNVNPSKFDLSKCMIMGKRNEETQAYIYQFKNGDFFYEWTQEQPGGKVIIEEESSALFFETGSAIKVVKEIDLKNI